MDKNIMGNDAWKIVAIVFCKWTREVRLIGVFKKKIGN